jgi:hypothetical protein
MKSLKFYWWEIAFIGVFWFAIGAMIGVAFCTGTK